jgi:hypothetical protein
MLPVAIIAPFGEYATASTQLVWPLRVCSGTPISQSQIRAVESPLPDTMVEEETGEKDVARMASPCPAMEAAHRETALTRKTA